MTTHSSEQRPFSEEELGARLRQYRNLRRLSLRELAARAEVTPSFLSQLENGRSSVSIGSLARIAAALSIEIAALFDTRTIGPTPMRASDRPLLRLDDKVRKTLLTPAPLTNLGLYGVTLEPGGSTGPEQYSHDGSHEVLIVVLGAVTVQLGEERFEMTEGDSIDFDSELPHRVANLSHSMKAEVHWAVSPAKPPSKRKTQATCDPPTEAVAS